MNFLAWTMSFEEITEERMCLYCSIFCLWSVIAEALANALSMIVKLVFVILGWIFLCYMQNCDPLNYQEKRLPPSLPGSQSLRHLTVNQPSTLVSLCMVLPDGLGLFLRATEALLIVYDMSSCSLQT